MRSARARRQAATATRRASSTSITPAGCSSANMAYCRASNAPGSSCGSTQWRIARRPCLIAFCAERALPAAVLGPRDLAPFARLAAARAGEEGARLLPATFLAAVVLRSAAGRLAVSPAAAGPSAVGRLAAGRLAALPAGVGRAGAPADTAAPGAAPICDMTDSFRREGAGPGAARRCGGRDTASRRGPRGPAPSLPRVAEYRNMVQGPVASPRPVPPPLRRVAASPGRATAATRRGINARLILSRSAALVPGPCDPGSPCAAAPTDGTDSHGRMDHRTGVRWHRRVNEPLTE